MASPDAIWASGIGSPPLRRASSTITRTPYSAFVENIIVISYLRARVSAASQLPDVVDERFGRQLFGAVEHPFVAPGVQQADRRVLGERPGPCRGRTNAVGLPDLTQPGRRPGQVLCAAAQRDVREEAPDRCGSIAGRVGADDHNGDGVAAQFVQRAPDL